jgi:hypothetical protein|tara:strand:+ start:573 stop:761 length:189 start_codon:yes stop_codon:yes gene_type:complete
MTELPWLIFIAASICGYGMGYTFKARRRNEIVEGTIKYLTINGYVRSHINEDDEIVMEQFEK